MPCESALVLLLSAISIGRVGLGLLLLLSFSLGLAGVLMGIGVMVLYAKRLLPKRSRLGQGSFYAMGAGGVRDCGGRAGNYYDQRVAGLAAQWLADWDAHGTSLLEG